MGQRYLGNQSHKEVHDLDNEKSNCEIDKIIAAKNDVPFNWVSRAYDKGYDNCAHCLGPATGSLWQRRFRPSLGIVPKQDFTSLMPR